MFKFQIENYLVLVFLFLLIFSCNEEKEETEVKVKEEVVMQSKEIPVPIVDKIIMSKIDSTINDYNYFSYWLMDSLSIDPFLDKIYTNQLNGYLCHSESRLEYLLYCNNELTRKLYIMKNSWFSEVGEEHKKINMVKSSFLDSIYDNATLIKRVKYKFNNIDSARRTIHYLNSKNIIFQHDILSEEKWPVFDGEFVFGYHDLNKNRNDDSIYSLINNLIPKDSIEFTLPQVLINYDTSKITYRAYCDEIEYENFKQNFNDFEVVSDFMRFTPIIYVYCGRGDEEQILEFIKNK